MIRFCNSCGSPVHHAIPPGDNLPRFICNSCDKIHYENPRIVVGCLVFSGDRILLCRRAIEPRLGYWTIPSGYMENGEEIMAGAARETREEANAEVDIISLHSIFSLPDFNQVHFTFLAHLVGDKFSPGEETSETALFSQQEIPWEMLAFTSNRFALEKYFNEGKADSQIFFGQSVHLNDDRTGLE